MDPVVAGLIEKVSRLEMNQLTSLNDIDTRLKVLEADLQQRRSDKVQEERKIANDLRARIAELEKDLKE